MATSHGAVLSYGNVKLFGSVGNTALPAPIVAIASYPGGSGYWMVGADGSIYAFGNSSPLGSTANIQLSHQIVGMAATSDGKGYWLVASDGGMFNFGDAKYFGSTGNIKLYRPIQAMTATPDGKGYWLVASDGGVFCFGDAGYFGSMGGIPLAKPIVGLTTTPDGKGYWMVATDGGIFSFGDAKYFGSMGAVALQSSIVGITATPDGKGYWEAAADGGIFNFGDAPFRGSDGKAQDLFYPVISIAQSVGTGTGVSAGASEGLSRNVPGTQGYDISWPQCNGTFPNSVGFGVVGITNGHGLSTNPCFASEAAWAGANLSIYMNADFFDTGKVPPQALNGPKGACASGDLVCEGYNYGYNSAQYAFNQAGAAGYPSDMWWLDVERGNVWTGNTTWNSDSIQGMLDALHANGVVVGIYSTSYQWGIIAGNFQPGVPNWYATGSSEDYPASCGEGFTGGPTWMVQAGWTGSDGNFDADYAC